MSTFSDLQRNSPKYPKETCPQIDEAKNRLAAKCETLTNILSELEDEAHDYFEQLRDKNGDLRDNATYWRESCEELAARVDDLEEENETLRKQVEDLKSELRSVERA